MRRPASAINSLQVHVSRLRRPLGRRVLASTPTGYRLTVTDAELDLLLFRSIVRDAAGREPGEACDAFARAGRLRRGDPVADLPDLHALPATQAVRREHADFVLAWPTPPPRPDGTPRSSRHCTTSSPPSRGTDRPTHA